MAQSDRMLACRAKQIVGLYPSPNDNGRYMTWVARLEGYRVGIETKVKVLTCVVSQSNVRYCLVSDQEYSPLYLP